MSNLPLKFLNDNKKVNYFPYQKRSNANIKLFCSLTLFYRLYWLNLNFSEMYNDTNLIRKSRFREHNTAVYSIVIIHVYTIVVLPRVVLLVDFKKNITPTTFSQSVENTFL